MKPEAELRDDFVAEAQGRSSPGVAGRPSIDA
jgi:hypothetical protein